jgi:putative copper export protein
LSFIALSGANTGRPLRVALWLSVATPLFLGLHLLTWMLNASPDHHLDSAWLASTAASTVGRVELLRTGLALLPLWALALARRSGLALALTIPSLLLSAAVGHSAAIHPMWAVPFKAMHLAALAVWIGGLLWIVVPGRDEAHPTTDIMRVSTLAMWAVVVVTLSGIVQTLMLVQSATGVRSPYGAVVMAKVAGLLVLVAFGAYHRRRLLPEIRTRGRDADSTLQSSVARELFVFCVVILLGGFLAYLTPPVSGDARASSHSVGAVP